MFLDSLKTLLTQGMTLTFNETYPVEEYQNLYFSIEYPVDRAAYPGVWVDFDPSDQLVNVGIGHAEYAEVDGKFQTYNRWEFRGHATYTIVALSSLERDRIFDELVRVIAFGLLEPARSVFRQTIDSNQFIAAIMNYDNIEVGGSSAVPGTPWGSQEIIYEITLSRVRERPGDEHPDPDLGLHHRAYGRRTNDLGSSTRDPEVAPACPLRPEHHQRVKMLSIEETRL